MRFIVFLITFMMLFSGCSGKEVYKSVIDFGRYQSNLLLKTTPISDDLNMTYLENNIESNLTLVLIHGFGANKDNWLELAKELDDKYHLIIPDLIGDGDSSKPFSFDYTIDNQTKILHQFLTQFENKNLVLVGNSMGGQIALNYAYYNSLIRLVLIDSMGLKVENSYVDKLGIKKIRDMYFNVCSVEKMQNMIDLSFNTPPYIPNIVLEHLTQEKCKESKLDTHKYQGILDKNFNLKDDMTTKSKSINTPTLIIWGEKDKIISVKNAYAFGEYIPNSEVVIFENIGHMPMMEDPELTAKAIINFLQR